MILRKTAGEVVGWHDSVKGSVKGRFEDWLGTCLVVSNNLTSALTFCSAIKKVHNRTEDKG